MVLGFLTNLSSMVIISVTDEERGMWSSWCWEVEFVDAIEETEYLWVFMSVTAYSAGGGRRIGLRRQELSVQG